jgi:hypothetical protein
VDGIPGFLRAFLWQAVWSIELQCTLFFFLRPLPTWPITVTNTAPLTRVLPIDSRLRSCNIGAIAPTNDPSLPGSAAQLNTSYNSNALSLARKRLRFGSSLIPDHLLTIRRYRCHFRAPTNTIYTHIMSPVDKETVPMWIKDRGHGHRDELLKSKP